MPCFCFVQVSVYTGLTNKKLVLPLSEAMRGSSAHLTFVLQQLLLLLRART